MMFFNIHTFIHLLLFVCLFFRAMEKVKRIGNEMGRPLRRLIKFARNLSAILCERGRGVSQRRKGETEQEFPQWRNTSFAAVGHCWREEREREEVLVDRKLYAEEGRGVTENASCGMLFGAPFSWPLAVFMPIPFPQNTFISSTTNKHAYTHQQRKRGIERKEGSSGRSKVILKRQTNG